MQRLLRLCALGPITLAAVLLIAVATIAQEIPAQDRGASALAQMLPRLRTTARLLHTTAHPDDDDGAMLVYEARGQGVRTIMQTLNRGEGGQNKVGAELFDELGILRTLELMEADRYYGVEQRFTRVVDFGFSKTADETFQEWGGHDAALGDIVREIRTFRPDVIVSRFSGTPRDGHGNHQAAGILSREAFKAAADPNAFPEQIREGLLPWQAKKLYIGVTPQNEATVRLDVGDYDPVLGMSYAQFSIEGLKHQASQGVGGFYIPTGDFFRTYQLVESNIPKQSNENGFFDGIDTSLPGLATRFGTDESRAPFLRPALEKADQLAQQAAAAFHPTDASAVAPQLADALKLIHDAALQLEPMQMAPGPKLEVMSELREKERQFASAVNLALGATLEASVDAPHPETGFGFFRQEQTFHFAVPGQTFTATARFFNRSKVPIDVRSIELVAPAGWKIEKMKSEGSHLQNNQQAWAQFRVTVPADAPYTRPYWHRDNTQQAVYTIDNPLYATLALPPYPLHARAVYAVGDGTVSIESVVVTKHVDPDAGQVETPLAVAPPMSVSTQPDVQVISTHTTGPTTVTVGVHNHVDGAAMAMVNLDAPAGWKVAPASEPARFATDGDFKNFQFTVTPPALHEGTYDLKAVVTYNGRSDGEDTYNGKKYSEDVIPIGRPDIGEFYYYRPSRLRISAVDVNVPRGMPVGYIMGAGDDIPPVLQQLGFSVHVISADELAAGDLTRFRTIVVGIRAYDVRTDVRHFNSRLLDFVKSGGTLLVQYQQDVRDFNAGNYAPYPLTLSRDRVTVEEAPVDVLAPNSPILHTPNPIAPRDFNGWVQERGLYFATKWAPEYQPVIASHDPGEQPLPGGLLVAHYGQGLYIYTGYAFFRQVPAGVPGAIRLFANLVSAGAENKAAR